MDREEELLPGIQMDAALARLMGIEPQWLLLGPHGDQLGPFSTRHTASLRKGMLPRGESAAYVYHSVYPALSTTDAGMGRVLDWLVGQGWDYTICGGGNNVSAVLSKAQAYPVGTGATRAEAVGRAALATREQEEQADTEADEALERRLAGIRERIANNPLISAAKRLGR